VAGVAGRQGMVSVAARDAASYSIVVGLNLIHDGVIIPKPRVFTERAEGASRASS
jgi:hypothetical protein